MTTGRIISQILEFPAVESINATTVQNKVKKYNIELKSNDLDARRKFENLWPFGEIKATKDSVKANYIVRPCELKEFYLKLSSFELKKSTNITAIVVTFNSNSLTHEVRKKITNSLRADDKVIWNEDSVAILVENGNRETVEIIQRRIKKILSTYCNINELGFSVQTQ